MNVEFDGLSIEDLIEPSMQNWVHHVQHILPQGRCSWFDPFQKPEDDFEDEDLDEDEEESVDVAQPETGPQLLTSVAEDEREFVMVTSPVLFICVCHYLSIVYICSTFFYKKLINKKHEAEIRQKLGNIKET